MLLMAMAPAMMGHRLNKTSPVFPGDELVSLVPRKKENLHVPCSSVPREKER